MAESGRILIADDEDTVLRTTAVLLREEGFTCDIARDAHQARELLSKDYYDLLITDWKMPGNTELELVRSVQKAGCRIPVIVITGYPQLNQAILSYGLSVFAEVIKPFEFDEFLTVVRDGVHVSRAHKRTHGKLE